MHANVTISAQVKISQTSYVEVSGGWSLTMVPGSRPVAYVPDSVDTSRVGTETDMELLTTFSNPMEKIPPSQCE